MLISLHKFAFHDTLIWNSNFMSEDSLKKMKDQLEYLFMRVVISGLKSDKLSIPEAKKLAQDFLAVEPFVSVEDAHAKINQFTSTHQGFSLLKEYAEVYYDEDKIDDKLEVMRKHLKENNIDEALRVAHS